MKGLFPVDLEINQVRAILKLIKDNGGSIGLARLSKEAREDIDRLLPFVEVSKVLGFAKVRGGNIYLTPTGKRMSLENYQDIIRRRIRGMEPFKSVLLLLKKDEITTDELARLLHGRGVTLYHDKITNELLLRNLLIAWGVRSRLLNYDASRDLWSVREK